ncbi:hypothetical protein [Phenylobacterium montanum]|uniref:GtrA family protein n=1 Tax=Phenylobacterium montanum TaxID=2823693 RepID=A0A975G128_9CAUL|nr:hypothetical protein [Caulobacter sp. S6]QUD88598.1 hypothetical protein KCG34_01515 [Caulobacter sp. S6]
MKLSPIPDLATGRRLGWTALALTVLVCAGLALRNGQAISSLGDTDDAMRLVLVRDLLSGRGWYDQWVGRLQPPAGTFMHWSRLLDGALAGAVLACRQVMAPALAETVVRLVWPLTWIYPAILAALLIARRFGGAVAVFVCGVVLATNYQVYEQFRPGRIDHHNIQIVMAAVAAACALVAGRSTRWAAVAGAVSGLGLAIGIEALPFQALIGASYGLRLLSEDGDERGPARAYGLSLTASLWGCYLIQTPPWRWSLSFCDSLALNLAAAVAIGGLGQAALATWPPRGRGARLAGLLVIGGAALATYLALDPSCLHGPFAAVDPRVRPFWFDRIGELQSWSGLWSLDRHAAVYTIWAGVLVAAGAVGLLASGRGRLSVETLLAAGLALLAVVLASRAVRLQDYVFWLGLPVFSAAVAPLMRKWLGGLMLPTVVAATAISPAYMGGAANALGDLALGKPAPGQASAQAECFSPRAYRRLAALPRGPVLSELDNGPFILAYTHHSALAAPYHRMSWGILAAHDALESAPDQAEARVRALKPAYVVVCAAAPAPASANGLEASLRRGRVPAWLAPVSAPGEVLQAYAVRVAGR